jgi:phosphoribosylaminoimidazole (AIR) synthetase
MVVVVSADDADKAIAVLDNHGESAWRIGRIVAGSQEVAYV